MRRQQGLTQEDVARACGFSKSLLCKIETGGTYPPVATLVRISGVLGTSLSALLGEGGGTEPVFTRLSDAAALMARTEKGYSVFPFAANRGGKRMQPYLFEARRGRVKRHAVSHAGEEFLYVVEGEILFQVGSAEYHLREGDSLFFDATEEHGVQAVSEVARYLDIFC